MRKSLFPDINSVGLATHIFTQSPLFAIGLNGKEQLRVGSRTKSGDRGCQSFQP